MAAIFGVHMCVDTIVQSVIMVAGHDTLIKNKYKQTYAIWRKLIFSTKSKIS